VSDDKRFQKTFTDLEESLGDLGYFLGPYDKKLPPVLRVFREKLDKILAQMSDADFRHILFESCNDQRAVYRLPIYGDLLYCGLEGIEVVLKKAREANDLGHPICV